MTGMTVATQFVRGSAYPLAQASDPELLTTVVWRKSAATGLQRSALDGDLTEFGRRIRAATPFRRAANWAKRVHPADIAACPPWWQPLWSRRAFGPSARSSRLVEFLASWNADGVSPSRKVRAGRIDRIAALLDEYEGPAPVDPFDQLSWGTLLLYGTFLPHELFGRLWCAAYRWAQSPAGTFESDEHPSWLADRQLLAEGEIPTLLGRVCSEVRGARRLAANGAQTLRAGLQKLTDVHGTPHARLLERLPLWLAPFVRATYTAQILDKPWWDDLSRVRFRRLVTQSAALCRSSGQTALSNGVTCAPVALLRTAARLAGLKPRHRTTRFLLSVADDVAELATDVAPGRRRDPAHRIGPKRRRPPPASRKHRPATQSDWAQLACLRNNWDLGADACVIAFDGRVPRIDLTAFGTPALSGPWGYATTIAGETAPPVEHWECVCWFTDGDADFVEIQGAAGGLVTFLRQVLLSRIDHFLLLNDVVKTADHAAGELSHTMRLPFTSQITATPDALTREWRVRAGSLPMRMFPLGLEQQAVQGTSGRLSISSTFLELTQRAGGCGLACPLLLDWSPVRRDEPAQWRRLTVAENGRALPPWQAAACRLRIGNCQWVHYHSLRPGETARTVLGLHTFHETVIGEFTPAGEIEPIVLVESTANE
jgi:hypothetical protein